MKQLADAEASLKQSEQDLKNLNEENENIS